MKIAVVVFPGTNCDEETRYVLGQRFGHQVDPVWHRETHLQSYDCVVLPGGFSYGDHLRAGAIARFSPVMQAVEQFAARDKLVLGICNGFQILAEAGLLPGTLLPNRGRSFLSTWVHCRVESERTPLTAGLEAGRVVRLPIAHGEGRYVADPATLARVERDGLVVLRYCDAAGNVTDEANPNGSLAGIAGVSNAGGNVLGLMPHPERAADPELPSQDGVPMFAALDRWSRGGAKGAAAVAGAGGVTGDRAVAGGLAVAGGAPA